jgi:hypothetical protein
MSSIGGFNKKKFELLLVHSSNSEQFIHILLRIFILFYFILLLFYLFFWGASPGSAGCFKKATQTPNAGHIILEI